MKDSHPVRHFQKVWWLWHDAQSLKWHKWGAILFFQSHPLNLKSCWPTKSTILTRIEHFHIVTPVWIYRKLQNDAQSLKWHREEPYCFFRSFLKSLGHRGWWNIRFWLNPVFPDYNSRLNSCTKLGIESGIEDVPYYFSMSFVRFHSRKGKRIDDLASIWAFGDDNLNSWMAMK